MLSVLIYIILGIFGLCIFMLCICVIFRLIYILNIIVNYIKQRIISFKIKKINKITLYPQKQLFREVRKKIGYSKGYSAGGHSYSDYYKITKVPIGFERKMDVYFDNGRICTVNIKENSRLYKKLMNNAKFI